MKKIRRPIVMLTAAILLYWTQIAAAAQPVVEIISLDHWPVQDALKPVRATLSKFADKIQIIELDADTVDGKKRIKSVGQKGHIPALILIDGKYRYTRSDGTDVEFINFPAAADSPMGLSGRWTAQDIEYTLNQKLQ